jgi:hypothetical protein
MPSRSLVRGGCGAEQVLHRNAAAGRHLRDRPRTGSTCQLGGTREVNYDAVPRVVFCDPQAVFASASRGPELALLDGCIAAQPAGPHA